MCPLEKNVCDTHKDQFKYLVGCHLNSLYTNDFLSLCSIHFSEISRGCEENFKGVFPQERVAEEFLEGQRREDIDGVTLIDS